MQRVHIDRLHQAKKLTKLVVGILDLHAPIRTFFHPETAVAVTRATQLDPAPVTDESSAAADSTAGGAPAVTFVDSWERVLVAGSDRRVVRFKDRLLLCQCRASADGRGALLKLFEANCSAALPGISLAVVDANVLPPKPPALVSPRPYDPHSELDGSKVVPSEEISTAAEAEALPTDPPPPSPAPTSRRRVGFPGRDCCRDGCGGAGPGRSRI